MLQKSYSQVYEGFNGAFSDKNTLNIDCFTDEPVVQCVVRVVKSTFLDVSKKVNDTNNKYVQVIANTF